MMLIACGEVADNGDSGDILIMVMLTMELLL
jgi:hypothetical protein